MQQSKSPSVELPQLSNEFIAEITHGGSQRPVLFLVGLDIRLAYSFANDACDRQAACYRAKALGTFSTGGMPSRLPTLFADVPELASAWEEGVDWAEEQLATTAMCCADSLDPCPHHG